MADFDFENSRTLFGVSYDYISKQIMLFIGDTVTYLLLVKYLLVIVEGLMFTHLGDIISLSVD